jgi:hypothetical protein
MFSRPGLPERLQPALVDGMGHVFQGYLDSGTNLNPYDRNIVQQGRPLCTYIWSWGLCRVSYTLSHYFGK